MTRLRRLALRVLAHLADRWDRIDTRWADRWNADEVED